MEKPNGQRLIRSRTARRKARARQLLKKGYSYRQIMRHLRLKSTATVAYYLKVELNQYQDSMLKKDSFIYSTVMEADGRVHREETFGGAALATIALALIVLTGLLFL